MRGALPAALLATVALTAGLSGCIQGAFFPAEIPAGALATGWRFDAANSESGEEGLEPLVKARYRANTYRDDSAFTGLAVVISVSDVPIFDEQGEIQKQLDAKVAEFGITFEPSGSGSGTIGPDSVTYTIQRATRNVAGATVRGFAIDIPYTCGANGVAVRVFGFAATEIESGLLGRQSDLTTWRELAGSDPGSTLGGMASRVVCSG